MSAVTRRRLPRPRAPRWPSGRRPRIGRRTLAALVVLVAVLVGGFFWLRSSSLVVVQQVRVTGVSGPDASRIRRLLVQTAEGMSTLDVDDRRLEAAVKPYRVVRSLSVHVHLFHSLTIAVTERIPVAQLSTGGQLVTVAADGELMRSYRGSRALPAITVVAIPAGDRVTGATLNEVHLLAAAPYALIAHVASVTSTVQLGLTAVLRNGPTVYFGRPTALAAKWRALVDTLGSSASKGASYIDVTDPRRVAAGSGADTSARTGATTTSSTTSSTVATDPPTSSVAGTAGAAATATTGDSTDPSTSTTG